VPLHSSTPSIASGKYHRAHIEVGERFTPVLFAWLERRGSLDLVVQELVAIMTLALASVDESPSRRRSHYLAQAARMRARAANAVDPEIHRTFLSLAAQALRLAQQAELDIGRQRGAPAKLVSAKKQSSTPQPSCVLNRHYHYEDLRPAAQVWPVVFTVQERVCSRI